MESPSNTSGILICQRCLKETPKKKCGNQKYCTSCSIQNEKDRAQIYTEKIRKNKGKKCEKCDITLQVVQGKEKICPTCKDKIKKNKNIEAFLNPRVHLKRKIRNDTFFW